MQLEYDVSYHLRCQFALKSGLEITLKALQQRMTYAGLLEGTPSQESNDWLIDAALKEAQQFCVEGVKPILIHPPRRNYLREPGDMDLIRRPHHIPEWMPMVTCAASFTAFPPRDPTKHISVMTVVWWQDEYALPIMQPALDELRGLDWRSLATDIEI